MRQNVVYFNAGAALGLKPMPHCEHSAWEVCEDCRKHHRRVYYL